MNKKQRAAQEALVEEWNKNHPIGTTVDVKVGNNMTTRTETTSEAWLMGGHTAMIMLEGISGGCAVIRVTGAEKKYLAFKDSKDSIIVIGKQPDKKIDLHPYITNIKNLLPVFGATSRQNACDIAVGQLGGVV